MKIICFALLFFPLCLIANESNFSSFTPYDEHKSSYLSPQENTLTFQGLLLENKAHGDIPAHIANYHGVAAYKISLPGNIVALKKKIRPFINAPLDKALILSLKKLVSQFYIRQGHPFIQILLPEQNLKTGVLRFVIKESNLGDITLEGKGHDTKLAASAKKKISLKVGEPINAFKLNQDLLYLNQNPFFEVDAIYYPGTESMTTNVGLRVNKKRGWRLLTGMDNTGNDVTGNNRFYAGVTLGNLFNTPQSLSYQFISAPNVRVLTSHILDYTAPLPWRHTLRLFGGFSLINALFDVPDITQTRFTTKGHNLQTSLRYEIPLKGIYSLIHQVQAGFDFKRTNNNILFSETSVYSHSEVNLAQLSCIYSLGYDSTRVKVAYNIESFFSPGDWLIDQSAEDYAMLRPKSNPLYAYARTSLKTSFRIKQGTLLATLRGQAATTNLLPSEEFGLGGLRTVRGYKERVVNGDNAFLLNCEYHTPSVSLMKLLGSYKKVDDSLTIIGFFDYGIMSLHKPLEHEKKSEYLSSIGTGLHYHFGPYLALIIDWGYELHHVPNDPNGQRLHFSFIANY